MAETSPAGKWDSGLGVIGGKASGAGAARKSASPSAANPSPSPGGLGDTPTTLELVADNTGNSGSQPNAASAASNLPCAATDCGWFMAPRAAADGQCTCQFSLPKTVGSILALPGNLFNEVVGVDPYVRSSTGLIVSMVFWGGVGWWAYTQLWGKRK